jgi:hypothetical protein
LVEAETVQNKQEIFHLDMLKIDSKVANEVKNNLIKQAQ